MDVKTSSESNIDLSLLQDEAPSGCGAVLNGRYVYGIAAGGNRVDMGRIGIEGNDVYTIPCRDISAIVHACPASQVQTPSAETVMEWVKKHQEVLDKARKSGTVIPLRFGVIVKRPEDEKDTPDEMVAHWLENDYLRLKNLLDRITGMDEYVVQIAGDAGILKSHLMEESPELRQIKEDLIGKTPGAAYLYQHKLEKVLKSEMEKREDACSRSFYERIQRYCAGIVVEKPKKLSEDRVMLLNLSCLVAQSRIHELGDELEKIGDGNGFSVHFSGPWPPYSFVGETEAASNPDK